MKLTITNEFIESLKSDKGGFTRKQLEAIGVTWPPEKGWKGKVIGKEIERETAVWLSNRAKHRSEK